MFFLTGTDEHGSKIAEAAGRAQSSPQAYADRFSGKFRELWERLGISNDDFIRTTEERHERVSAQVFLQLFEKGDITLGSYEDWYCVPCETFILESELREGKCPTCGRPVERLREESYFFRLSKYEKALLEHFEENPGFLSPPHRAQEIVNFVKSGLKDLSVSRPASRVAWGIPVPAAEGLKEGHTIYVWFEALLNYVTAAGYDSSRLNPKTLTPAPLPGGEGTRKRFDEVWPADVHLVGKEIFRFHTVIWPAMLMALGLPLPAKVFAHGWWTVEGQKMSKSLGNVVDPHAVCDEYGVDAFRYFLLREVPFGSDGDFSQAALLNRFNAELANALGNLLSRTSTLIAKHFEGALPPEAYDGHGLLSDLAPMTAKVKAAYESLAFQEALETIWSLVWKANKFIDEQAPWKLGVSDRERLARVLGECSSVLQVLALFLSPVMPLKAEEMWRALGRADRLEEAGKALILRCEFNPALAGPIQKGEPLFPRKGRWK